jgi:hypothetical protein
MAKAPTTAHNPSPLATPEDIRRILGNFDNGKLLEIMALRPTVQDVEDASLWLAGNSDIFGAGKPLPRTAGDIVAIIAVDEEDDRTR